MEIKINIMDSNTNNTIQPACDEDKNDKRKRFMTGASNVYDVIEVLALSISIVYLVFCFVFRVAVVNGPSMNYTLADGDNLVVMELFYKPKQGDVIVCQNEYIGYDEPIVKRVIALAGQTITVDFENWKVYVDGDELDEDYVNKIAGTNMRGWSYGESYTVPEGHIFVMGDNRNNSLDSRNSMVGPIDERLVIGRVVFRFWPISSFGTIS